MIHREVHDTVQLLDSQRHRAKRRRTLTTPLAVTDTASHRRETHQRITETISASAEKEMGLIVKIFQERSIVDSTPQPIVRAWNPGHYIRGDAKTPLDATLLTAGVKGFVQPYYWRTLEPQQNSYDGVWTGGAVANDLQWCLDHNCRLVLMIVDRTFFVSDGDPMPSYFGTPAAVGSPGQNQYVTYYPANHGQNGVMANRWNTSGPTPMRDRMKALIDAIAQNCDGHPAFEGLYFQESALALDNATLTAWGYTVETYRDYYIDILTYAATAMPASRIFFCFNFFSQTPGLAGTSHPNWAIDGVLSAIEPLHAIVAGGPDCLPESGNATNSLVGYAYPYYGSMNWNIGSHNLQGYNNRIPMMVQLSPPGYVQEWGGSNPIPYRYWAMDEMYGFMKDQWTHKTTVANPYLGQPLGVSYCFWYPVQGTWDSTGNVPQSVTTNGWKSGAAPLGRTIAANNQTIFNYTGPK